MSSSDVAEDVRQKSGSASPLSPLILMANGGNAGQARLLMGFRTFVKQCVECDDESALNRDLDILERNRECAPDIAKLRESILGLQRQRLRTIDGLDVTGNKIRTIGQELSPSLRIGAPQAFLDLKVPLGYSIADAGVTKNGNNSAVQVSPVPIGIYSRIVSFEGQVSLRLAWLNLDGEWQLEVFQRSMLVDHTKIIRLADRGVPVSSTTHRLLAAYLAKFENDNSLDTEYVTQSMGWTSNMSSFVIGNNVIGEQNKALTILPRDGMGRFTKYFHTNGTLEGWYAAVNIGITSPRFMLSIYASLLSPLLSILGLDLSYFVDFSASTGKGKTVALRGAASLWGVPEIGEGVIQKWGASLVGFTELAILYGNLPVIIDDSRNAETKPELIQDIIMTYSTGTEKLKGAQTGGVRVGGHWHGVAISSSERQLTKYTTGDGVDARCLCINGVVTPTAEMAESLEREFYNHYGHFGARWVEFLLSMKHEWPAWKAHYEKLYGQACKTDSLSQQNRLTKLIVAMDFARHLAEQIGLPRAPMHGETNAAIALAMGSLYVGTAAIPKSVRAVEIVLHVLTSMRKRFPSKADIYSPKQYETPYGFYEGPPGAAIFFCYWHSMEFILKRHRHNLDEVIPALLEYGLIDEADIVVTVTPDNIALKMWRIDPIALSQKFQKRFYGAAASA